MENLNLNHGSWEILQEVKDYDGVESREFVIDGKDGKKATVIDLGINVKIGDELSQKIGVQIAQATMGSLGRVELTGDKLTVTIPKHPTVATLGCQLAGWSVEIEGKKKLGSGPARIPAGKPGKIINKIGYIESPQKSALVLETNTLPGEDTCKKILDDTKSRELVIAALRDDTTIGLINVLARIVEVGIFRLNNLGYDVNKIVSASGSVPIPPITPDIMFTSNDAIIYQGMVSLEVNGWDPELTEKAVSKSSGVYGKSFKEIFEDAGGDFYKVDPEIFAPAKLDVIDTVDGKDYHAGEII